MTALAIEVERLVKRFGDLVAVDGIDLAVPTGTCLGLLGPNGAGKTTTVEILEGLQPATSGRVRVLGRTWAEDPDGIRARIGIRGDGAPAEQHQTYRAARGPRSDALRIASLHDKDVFVVITVASLTPHVSGGDPGCV
jgi:ABC-type cobalamin/Fe3+-siderophores transport system ATPase subunit